MGSRISRVSVFIFLSFFLCSFSLYAYQLSPLNVTYSPSGIDSSAIYTIVNDSDNPIAVEVKAAKRSIDIDGEEYNEDASAYFSIQPSKMIIRPQSTQLVRVQYRGPKTVTKELSFRIISEQISYSTGAVSTDAEQMISFLFVYSTSAYIKPSYIAEKVSAAATVTDGKLEIIVSNDGSVHQLLNDLEISVKGSDGAEYTLTDDEAAPLNGKNLLVDSKLHLFIDIPEELDNSTSYEVLITYNFDYE